MAYKLILKRRTIRRFQEKAVPFSLLKKCINAARLSPTARNTQPLEFVAVHDAEQAAKVNDAVHFGGVVREKGRVKEMSRRYEEWAARCEIREWPLNKNWKPLGRKP